MKQVKATIFPTEVWVIDDVLIDYQKRSIVESVYSDDSGKGKPIFQSRPDLHKDAAYRPLVDKVIECAKNYVEDKKWQYQGFKITGMWSNIQREGQNFHPHTHSNNIISGVYYAKSNKNRLKEEYEKIVNSDIVFVDPRPQAGVLKPNNLESNQNNSDLWFFPSFENRMLLFPSWLSHYVPVNKSKEDRISIAFNVMLTGQVGKPEEYQSADF